MGCITCVHNEMKTAVRELFEISNVCLQESYITRRMKEHKKTVIIINESNLRAMKCDIISNISVLKPIPVSNGWLYVIPGVHDGEC